MSPLLHSSAGCESSTRYTNIWWSTTSPVGVRWCTEPNRTSSWRKQWKAPQISLSSVAMTERTLSHIRRFLCRQPGLWARHFQEASIPKLLADPTLSLPSGWQLHLVEAPDPGRLQSHRGQPWVKRLEPKQHDPSRPRAEDYYSFHDCKGYCTSQCQSLCKYLEDLIQ